jgi:hypothetical protein
MHMATITLTNIGALPVLSFDRRFAASQGVELLRSS